MKSLRCSGWKSLIRLKRSWHLQFSSHQRRMARSDSVLNTERSTNLLGAVSISLNVWTSASIFWERPQFYQRLTGTDTTGKVKYAKGERVSPAFAYIVDELNPFVFHLYWKLLQAHFSEHWTKFCQQLTCSLHMSTRMTLWSFEKPRGTYQLLIGALKLSHNTGVTFKLKSGKLLSYSTKHLGHVIHLGRLPV